MTERFGDQNDFDGYGNGDNQVQHALTLGVMKRIGVTLEELWVHYLSMGGDIDQLEVGAYLHGLMRLPAIERDLLSQSVNEILDDICHGPRAPFSTDRSGTGPETDGSDLGSASWMTGGQELTSIVYSSVATRAFGAADLAGLLRVSRHNNAASDLTGLLLHRNGRFLQVLEGPAQTVHERMTHIAADSRHTAVRILIEERTQQRQFPSWTMRWQSVSDTQSDEVPGFERTFAEIGQDADPAGTVRATKELVRWFERWS